MTVPAHCHVPPESERLRREVDEGGHMTVPAHCHVPPESERLRREVDKAGREQCLRTVPRLPNPSAMQGARWTRAGVRGDRTCLRRPRRAARSRRAEARLCRSGPWPRKRSFRLRCSQGRWWCRVLWKRCLGIHRFRGHGPLLQGHGPLLQGHGPLLQGQHPPPHAPPPAPTTPDTPAPHRRGPPASAGTPPSPPPAARS